MIPYIRNNSVIVGQLIEERTQASKERIKNNNLEAQKKINELDQLSIKSKLKKLTKINNALFVLLKVEMIKVHIYNKIAEENINVNNKVELETNISNMLTAAIEDQETQNKLDNEILAKIEELVNENPNQVSTAVAVKIEFKNTATRSALKETLLEHQGYVSLINHLKQVWAPESEKNKSLLELKKEKMAQLLKDNGENWLDNIVETSIQENLKKIAATHIVNEINTEKELVKKELKKTSTRKP